MKRLAVFLLFAAALGAQTAFRVDPISAFTTTGTTPAGAYAPVFAVSGATISVCTTTACSAQATTYTSGAAGTTCPAFAQVVLPGSTACQATAGSLGQFGFWMSAGTYYYTITYPNGQMFGPYPFSVGGSGGGGGAVNSVFGRTGNVVANTNDYTAAQVLNAADTSQFYSNPGWITALAGTKIVGAVATATAFATLPTPCTAGSPALGVNTLGSSVGCNPISEAQVSFTDITTNNSSTSKHGFMPKLSGDASKCFVGDGTQITCPGGSGLVPVISLQETSSVVRTFGNNCTSNILTNPCRFKFGDTVNTATSALTVATVSAGTGTVYVYETNIGGIIVGFGTGVSAGNITGTGATFGISAFPTDGSAIPLWSCTVTSGTWDTGGCTAPQAVLNQGKQTLCGSGLSCVVTPTTVTLSSSGGGGGAITPDFQGVTGNITNTGSAVTVYTTTVTSLGAGQCFEISFGLTAPAVTTRVDLYVNATLIATPIVNLNNQSMIAVYRHCNLPGVQNSQQTFLNPQWFYANAGLTPINIAASSVDTGLYQTSAVNEATSFTVALKTTAASGNSVGAYWSLQ